MSNHPEVMPRAGFECLFSTALLPGTGQRGMLMVQLLLILLACSGVGALMHSARHALKRMLNPR
jgi:hypothetical protein